MIETKVKRKRGGQRINRGYTHVRVDIDTYNRLKVLAGDIKLGAFLRHFIKLASGEIENVDNLTSVEYARFLAAAEIAGDAAKNWKIVTVSRLNSEDKVVEASDYGPDIPSIDAIMIDAAVEADPNVTKVGWYNKIDGKWVFDTAGYEKMLKEESNR